MKFIPTENNECRCTWPNGESMIVMVIKIVDDKAEIIYNQKIGHCVRGGEDTVPIKWLSEK